MEVIARVKTKDQFDALKESGFKGDIISSVKSGLATCGFFADNFDELAILIEEKKKSEMRDFRIFAGELLYSYNKEAINFFKELVPQIEFIAPSELTLDELKKLEKNADIKFAYKIYGHQLLMITNQCFKKNYFKCEKEAGRNLNSQEFIKFKNESGSYLALNECSECKTRIYNAVPLYMLDKLDEFSDSKVLLDFTVETKEEIKNVLKDFNSETLKTLPKAEEISRGHYYKGID